MMKNLFSIEDLRRQDILSIVDLAALLKKNRDSALFTRRHQSLSGEFWALVFSKSSTRTRISFEVGVRELGGKALFLSADDLQLGRGEPIIDTARVAGRMLHGAIIRTYDHEDLLAFHKHADIPVINALTDQEHPCQILADLVTASELFQIEDFSELKICFYGDCACNVARSWLWAAARLGFTLCLCCPKNAPVYAPDHDTLRQANSECRGKGQIYLDHDPKSAAKNAHILYTDVWVSMGMEEEKERRLRDLNDYQINSDIVACALPEAQVMHCLPAYRGLEIDEETLEKFASTIFDQAENRLHAQKAVLSMITKG